MPSKSLFPVWTVLRKKKKPQYRSMLSVKDQRMRQGNIMRRALRFPIQSPFFYLFGSGCDPSLITLTGFNHAAFRYIPERFAPLYVKYTPHSKDGYVKLRSLTRNGRPRITDASTCLGLLLAHTRTRGSLMNLSLIFGCTGTAVSLYVRFARQILFHVVIRDEEAAVSMPSESERVLYTTFIETLYPCLKDVYCFADGIKLRLQKSGNEVIQSRFYNGWTHDHYVGNILVFSPTGIIIACGLNAPGSLHDSNIADKSGVYKKLEHYFHSHGGLCVIDSAFSRGRYPFLLKSSPNLIANACNALQMEIGRQATSLRQSVE